MNSYTYSQRLLHRIALSYPFLREVFFDLEKTLFLRNEYKIKDKHVFVSGMARSGTTILLNAIYHTNEFASLTYKDMPFILFPNIGDKLFKNGMDLKEEERAHGDGIKINTNSPEAFEEVFWNTFSIDKSDTSIEFLKFIKLLCVKYNKTRYLSKNNQNIKRIDYLIKLFPNSKIIVPFRNPLQHAFSLFSQHKKFISLQKEDDFIRKYMSWIGHSEFGLDYIPYYQKNLKYSNFNEINHWLEQWYHSYMAIKHLKKMPQVMFVCYEQLCADKLIYKKILNFIDIKQDFNYDFILSLKKVDLPIDHNLFIECELLYDSLKSENLSK